MSFKRELVGALSPRDILYYTRNSTDEPRSFFFRLLLLLYYDYDLRLLGFPLTWPAALVVTAALTPGTMQRSAIFIPCLNTDEVVSVAVADLPDDADEMLEVLTAESAPLSLWIEVAKAYLAQGKYKQYERILEMGTSPETEQFFCNPKDGSYNSSVEHGYYHGVEYDRIQVLCSLADYYTKCLKAELNTHKRIAHLEKAAALVARAQRLGFSEQLPRLMDAQLTLARVSTLVMMLSFTCLVAAELTP